MVEEQRALIGTYFPDLDSDQILKFDQLFDLYKYWNDQINVISRKDIDNFYLHHVLHSLSIAKFVQFEKETKVLDLGTGGGFPGIPLAILFPEVNFNLLDATRKKLTVINEVAQALNIPNIKTWHQRAEEHSGKYNFVVCRAVADISILKNYTIKLMESAHSQALPNGLIALKGGDLKAELKNANINHAEIVELKTYFEESFFETKQLIYVQF